MTIEEFNTLDEHEQHEAVWSGVCIGYREEGEYRIVIYKIDSFYTELYYHPTVNVLRKVKAIPTIETEIISTINPATLYE